MIMSINQDADLAKDNNLNNASHVSSPSYPWLKLHNQSIEDNSNVSKEIFRKPSLDLHASFDDSSKSSLSSSTNENTSLPNLSLSMSENLFGTSELESGQLQHEIQIQDDYLKEKFNLYRFKTIPDGNCMYRALAKNLAHDQNQHLNLRNEVVNYIRNHRQEFQAITEEPFEIFLEQASKENSWGSYVELLAITKLFSINIVIVTGGSPSNPAVNVTCHHFDSESKSITPKDTVWLSWLSNGHYDLILNKPIENKHYEEWLTMKNERLQTDAILAEALSTSQNYDENYGETSQSINQTSNSANPSSICQSTLEEDEKLARNLQDAENVFGLYGLTE